MTDKSDLPREEGDIVAATRSALKDAADWTADRLEDASVRLRGVAGNDEPQREQPSESLRPGASHRTPSPVQTPSPVRTPPPVQGDAGARAAGSVEDDITDDDGKA
jgi:hypothetical protein